MINAALTPQTDGCWSNGVRVVRFDRLILRRYFSELILQTHQLQSALLRETRCSTVRPCTQAMHKKLQDEKNSPQMSSGFVCTAVIATFQQPSKTELIHKGKPL